MYKDGEPYLKKCKHLVRLNNGKTLCREYHKSRSDQTKNGFRIDTMILNGEKKEVFCVWRKSGHWNYKGCPFNIKNVPLFEDHCKSMGLIK
jgi:hypothetical protein